MKIRKASTEDADSLTQIAHEAKRYWGYPEHWIRHWQNDLTITSEYIERNDVFVAEGDDALIGFYALVLSDDKAELDHLWVVPGHIGTGVGKQLFIHAMRSVAGSDVEAVEILADPNAEGFYQKMGAYRIGEHISEIDDQPRVLPKMTIDPKAS